jgi:hypothetical protein
MSSIWTVATDADNLPLQLNDVIRIDGLSHPMIIMQREETDDGILYGATRVEFFDENIRARVESTTDLFRFRREHINGLRIVGFWDYRVGLLELCR